TGEGKVEAVELLLEAGMDPNQSRTPTDLGLLNELAYGSDARDRQLIGLLLDHRADPNAIHRQTQKPPLAVAEDAEAPKMLLTHGADMNWNGPGGSALIHSILTSHWDNATSLTARGADLELQTA